MALGSWQLKVLNVQASKYIAHASMYAKVLSAINLL